MAPIKDFATITKLRDLGSLWQHGGKSRIYFNDLPTLYGLSVQRYNTGNVQGASLNGQKLSNSKASALLSRLGLAKLYFDLQDGLFHGQGLTQGETDALMSSLLAKLQESDEATH